eukprot:Ihof_evm2s77 gene=Ihof_evmTU2s77
MAEYKPGWTALPTEEFNSIINSRQEDYSNGITSATEDTFNNNQSEQSLEMTPTRKPINFNNKKRSSKKHVTESPQMEAGESTLMQKLNVHDEDYLGDDEIDSNSSSDEQRLYDFGGSRRHSYDNAVDHDKLSDRFLFWGSDSSVQDVRSGEVPTNNNTKRYKSQRLFWANNRVDKGKAKRCLVIVFVFVVVTIITSCALGFTSSNDGKKKGPIHVPDFLDTAAVGTSMEEGCITISAICDPFTTHACCTGTVCTFVKAASNYQCSKIHIPGFDAIEPKSTPTTTSRKATGAKPVTVPMITKAIIKPQPKPKTSALSSTKTVVPSSRPLPTTATTIRTGGTVGVVSSIVTLPTKPAYSDKKLITATTVLSTPTPIKKPMTMKTDVLPGTTVAVGTVTKAIQTRPMKAMTTTMEDHSSNPTVSRMESLAATKTETIDSLPVSPTTKEIADNSTLSLVPIKVIDGTTLSLVPTKAIDSATLSLVPTKAMDSATLSLVPTKAMDSATLSLVPTKAINNTTLSLVPAEAINNTTLSLVPIEAINNTILLFVPTKVINSTTLSLVPTKAINTTTFSLVPTKVIDNTTLSLVPTEAINNTTLLLVPTEAINNTTLSLVPTEAINNTTLPLVPTEVIGSPILPLNSTEAIDDTTTSIGNKTVEIAFGRVVSVRSLLLMLSSEASPQDTPPDGTPPPSLMMYNGLRGKEAARVLHADISNAIKFRPSAFNIFCAGEPEQARREAAAFLAHSHKSSNGFTMFEQKALPTNNYCSKDVTIADQPAYPCKEGKSYHGRGPMMLTGNVNYGRFSNFVFGNTYTLLYNPERVSNEPILGWISALWLWTVPRTFGGPCPKRRGEVEFNLPSSTISCHDAMADVLGFGETISIIRGNMECCPNAPDKDMTLRRIISYLKFSAILDVKSPAYGCSEDKTEWGLCDFSK